MATAKFTVKRGALNRKDVAVSAGTAEAQTDTMSLNIDFTAIRKAQVVEMLTALQNKILSGPWPPL